MKRPHRFADSDHGATAVELALLLPILLLLFFGIIVFGQLLNTQVSLTGAAREGVRVMAVTNEWPAARDATIAAAPSVENVSPTRVPASCSPGDTVTVTARQDPPITYSIPFYGDLTIDLEGQGVMRCGG